MDTFWSSVNSWFKEKTQSPLYFTYSLYFTLWNWKFFQVIFLEDSALFSTPRIEYISTKLSFSFKYLETIAHFPEWLELTINWFLNFSWKIIPPMLFTYLTIRYLPPIQKWALEQYLDSRTERRQMYHEREKKFNEWLLGKERAKEETLEEIVETKKKQARQIEIIESTNPLEKRWKEEYKSIQLNPTFQRFQNLVDAIYNRGGLTHRVIGSQWQKVIDAELLAFADTKGLINIQGGGNEEKIIFTDKGKFVLGEYLESKK